MQRAKAGGQAAAQADRGPGGASQRVVRGGVEAPPTERLVECGDPTTVAVTRRGRSATLPASRGERLGAAWTMWALGPGTFVYATPLEASPRRLQPRATASVQVFASAAPSEPHVHVALLEVRRDAGSPRGGLDPLIQRVREKAGELGCDAVCIGPRSSPASPAPAPSSARLDAPAPLLLARCIVFTRTQPFSRGENSSSASSRARARPRPGNSQAKPGSTPGSSD